MKRWVIPILLLLLVLTFGGAVPPFTTLFMRTVLDDATSGAARTTLEIQLEEFAPLRLGERSTDPSKPAEGVAYIWLSDGTGYGEDGDVIIAVTAGGVTHRGILFTFTMTDIWY